MLFVLLGCVEESNATVHFTGTVQDAPANAGDPVVGATVTSQNDDGDVVGTATTGSDGTFDVEVKSGSLFFITVSDDVHVPTSFSGLAGLSDFTADTGFPWLATRAWLDEQTALFEGCARSGDQGTVVLGQTVVYIAEIADYSQWPALGGAAVSVLDSAGNTHEACYLDDAGASAPTAAETGATGWFAAFGVAPGGIHVSLTVDRSDGNPGTDVFEFIAPESGLVPIFPAALAL